MSYKVICFPDKMLQPDKIIDTLFIAMKQNNLNPDDYEIVSAFSPRPFMMCFLVKEIVKKKKAEDKE